MSGGREGARICIFMHAFCHRQTSPPVPVSSTAHSWAGGVNEVMGGGAARHTDAAAPPSARENKLELSVPQTGHLHLCAQAIFVMAYCLCAFIHSWCSS